MKIYEEGGCVRDQFRGVASNDIDYAVETESYDSMKKHIANHYKIVYEKPEYLTIKAKDAKNIYDFVLCRKDGCYRDGRHPESTIPGTIYDDLARRDFTINSIAIDVDTGDIIDPYDGIRDIKQRMIRCTGKTKDRITEDALRLLRAFRFHVTLNFELDIDIHECLHDETCVRLLENVSKERILSEISKCFAFNSYQTIKSLSKYPVLMEYLFQYICLKPQYLS